MLTGGRYRAARASKRIPESQKWLLIVDQIPARKNLARNIIQLSLIHINKYQYVHYVVVSGPTRHHYC